MNRKRVPKWLLRRYFHPVREDGEIKYKCNICGEIIEKRNRTMHLKTHHPQVWMKIEGGEK